MRICYLRTDIFEKNIVSTVERHKKWQEITDKLSIQFRMAQETVSFPPRRTERRNCGMIIVFSRNGRCRKQRFLHDSIRKGTRNRYANEVQTLSLGAFVTALKAANEKVRTLTATRTDERMTKIVGTLKASRKASDEAYRLLVKYVNAYALIEGDEKYLNFIDYVNTEIVHYKREAIGQKSGSAQTSGTTDGTTTGGGSTGGSTTGGGTGGSSTGGGTDAE